MPRTRRTAPPAPEGNAALEGDLGWAVRMLSTAFSRTAIGAVEELPGGPRGYLVLVALSVGEPPTQLVLAGQVSLDRTVMTYLLDDLEAAGLVARQPDPRDRRARLVGLTDAGRDAVTQARRKIAEAEHFVLADLDDSEAVQFRTLLTRIARTAQRSTGLADC